MPLSRRDFIRISIGGTIVTIGGLRSAPTSALAAAATSASGPGTLVLVTLYGGNDAMNMVAPLGDPLYAALRQDLAIDPAAAHDLGEGFALHPAMEGCKRLWDASRLAVVRGTGFPGLDRSHFHCMDVWQAGDEHDHATGWIGRWLDATADDPLSAINVGTTLPLAMRGARRSAAVVPPNGQLDVPGGDTLRSGITAMMAEDAGRSPLEAAVAASSLDLLDVVDRVGPHLVATGDEGSEVEAGDENSLSAQLGVVASLVEAGLPTRVYGVSLGGFDTHADQAPTHEQLLAELDDGLSSFVDEMGTRPVTVLVYSEFGRRVAPNGSGGTDHGTAGTMLLAGRVRGGFHGEPSPLDDLHDGDLATTTDFRAVYAGVLEAVLETDGDDIIDGAPTALAVV